LAHESEHNKLKKNPFNSAYGLGISSYKPLHTILAILQNPSFSNRDAFQVALFVASSEVVSKLSFQIEIPNRGSRPRFQIKLVKNVYLDRAGAIILHPLTNNIHKCQKAWWPTLRW
jgi:hypothetical protein